MNNVDKAVAINMDRCSNRDFKPVAEWVGNYGIFN